MNSNENKTEYDVLNLGYEYHGMTGGVKWAVITDLDVETLMEMYGTELEQYMPYVVMSKEQGEVFREYDRNEKKHEMRRMRYHDMEGYDEGTTENIKGIYSNDVPEDAVMGKMEHERFKEAIEKLPTVQKRSILYFYHGLLEGEIARAEGVTQQMVAKSLDQAMRNLKAFLKL